MAIAICFLGTDTQFTPKEDLPGGYDRYETLSVCASLIRGERTTDPVVTYSGQKTHVITGPDTMGYNVGNRIANGILCFLNAVMTGETDVIITAHSRGAVEAILFAHEIQRLVTTFTAAEPGDPNPEMITQGQDKSRYETYRKLADFSAYGAIQTEPLKTKFKEFINSLNSDPAKMIDFRANIGQVKLNIFNIDPVPGGNCQGVPTRWEDSRFYELPPVVKHYTQIVYQHERSRSFKAIIPKVNDPKSTQFTLLPLPGIHGTGSGNLFDHKRARMGDPTLGIEKTSHVQDLIALKIIHFFLSQGITAEEMYSYEESNSTLPPSFLSLAFIEDHSQPNSYRLRTADEIRIQIIDAYNKILENKAAYQTFENSCYATGREGSWQAILGQNPIIGRLVHHHKHTKAGQHVYLTDVTEDVVNPDCYVNAEHAALCLEQANRELGITSRFDEGTDLTTYVTKIQANLFRICDKPLSTEANIRPDSPIIDYGLYQRAYVQFMNRISQLYLRGDLDINGRKALLSQLNQIFAEFDQKRPHIQADTCHDLAVSCQKALTDCTLHSLRNKQTTLLENAKGLKNLLRMTPDILRETLKESLAKLETISPLNPLASVCLSDCTALVSFMTETLPRMEGNTTHIAEIISFLINCSKPSSSDDSDTSTQTDNSNSDDTMQILNDFAELISDLNTIADPKLILSMFVEHMSDSTQIQYAQKTLAKTLPRNLSDYQKDKELLAEEVLIQDALLTYLHAFKVDLTREPYNEILSPLPETIKNALMEKYDILTGKHTKEIEALRQKSAALITQHQTQLEEIRHLKEELDTLKERGREIVTGSSYEREETHSDINQPSTSVTTKAKTPNDESRQQTDVLNEELQDENKNLQEAYNKLLSQITTINKNLEQQTAEYHNNIKPEDDHCSNVINQQLLPLTKRYQDHLQKKINLCDAQLQKHNKAGTKKHTQLENRLQQLNEKKKIIDSLWDILSSNVQESPAPNLDKVKKFYEKLFEENSKPTITAHRDPAWKRYLANTAQVAALLLTGILPGVIFLAIKTAITGKGPLHGQSHGSVFFKDVTRQLPEHQSCHTQKNCIVNSAG